MINTLPYYQGLYRLLQCALFLSFNDDFHCFPSDRAVELAEPFPPHLHVRLHSCKIPESYFFNQVLPGSYGGGYHMNTKQICFCPPLTYVMPLVGVTVWFVARLFQTVTLSWGLLCCCCLNDSAQLLFHSAHHLPSIYLTSTLLTRPGRSARNNTVRLKTHLIMRFDKYDQPRVY